VHHGAAYSAVHSAAPPSSYTEESSFQSGGEGGGQGNGGSSKRVTPRGRVCELRGGHGLPFYRCGCGVQGRMMKHLWEQNKARGKCSVILKKAPFPEAFFPEELGEGEHFLGDALRGACAFINSSGEGLVLSFFPLERGFENVCTLPDIKCLGDKHGNVDMAFQDR